MNKEEEEVEKIIENHKNLIEYFEIFKKFSLIRFAFSPKKEDKKSCLTIILNDNFCLWFFKNGDEWKYDGWEIGDYSEIWKDRDL